MLVNIIKKNIHIFFIFCFISFFIQSEIVKNSFGSIELFADFYQTLLWLKCHSLGFDLQTTNLIDCGTDDELSGPLHYGYAFLSIPYNEKLDIFYRIYFPYILIFFFIYLTVNIINPTNKQEIILLYLALLNPSSILLIERLNLDCLIFILIIIIAYNRIYFINWFLIIYLTLIKIYPITLCINILIENPKRNIMKIFLIFLILSILSLIYLYINKELYTFMLENLGINKAGYFFLFSLNSIPKIFKYIFNINYIILLFTFYSLFIFAIIKFYKYINISKNYFKDQFYTFESKIFIVGGYTTLFIFIITSNWFYKEVFLILLIPLIIKMKNKYQIKFFNILIYFFIFRYFYSFLYCYINVTEEISYIDDKRIFSNKFLLIIFLKSLFDFLLMSIVAAILFIKTKLYINSKINK